MTPQIVVVTKFGTTVREDLFPADLGFAKENNLNAVIVITGPEGIRAEVYDHVTGQRFPLVRRAVDNDVF